MYNFKEVHFEKCLLTFLCLVNAFFLRMVKAILVPIWDVRNFTLSKNHKTKTNLEANYNYMKSAYDWCYWF